MASHMTVRMSDHGFLSDTPLLENTSLSCVARVHQCIIMQVLGLHQIQFYALPLFAGINVLDSHSMASSNPLPSTAQHACTRHGLLFPSRAMPNCDSTSSPARAWGRSCLLASTSTGHVCSSGSVSSLPSSLRASGNRSRSLL